MGKLIKITKYISLLSMVMLFTGCDLELQENYDFDESATIHLEYEPFDVTIWEFMNQESADFSLMIEAVQLAGMESTFSGGQDDKTILLLRNEAMEDFLDNQGVTSVAEIDPQVLQNFLNYHIITRRFTNDELNSQEYVTMQTLNEGPDGRIVIWRWRRYMEIQINRNGSPERPGTAKGTSVYLHNYEFTNGVGHQLRTFVRWAPF